MQLFEGYLVSLPPWNYNELNILNAAKAIKSNQMRD